MSDPQDHPTTGSRIADAIRAKRDGKPVEEQDWEALAADLVHDIESFDLDLAERTARNENQPHKPAGLMDTTVVFPALVPEGVRRAAPTPAAPAANEASPATHSPLLDDLRNQAREHQRQLNQELAQRTQANQAMDQRLRKVFLYLHELVQQLNILRPTVARRYELADDLGFADLIWQEGFADYRTQAQSAGALVETVTFSYQLASPIKLRVERTGPAIERFRERLFDYGLHFRRDELHNQRRQVVEAVFEIDAELAVSTRWRADYQRGVVVVESRNLERLGTQVYTLAPENLNQAFLDEFGHLVLGQPSRFRSLGKR